MREKKGTIFCPSDKSCPLLKSSLVNNSKNSVGIVYQLDEFIIVFLMGHYFINLRLGGIIIADKYFT